jgi:hypothetical protein
MILHPPALLAARGALALALSLPSPAMASRSLLAVSATLFAAILVDRAVEAVQVWRRFHDPAALALVPIHLLRDAAWSIALLAWPVRRLRRRAGRA